ncbi:hypothetical protein IW261DRAFT_1614826 [Armillaria novae-zelandiae]|uniref:Uncharacterized protein n=1 Tax=Armillaria novae-zelandiae TaxID=153914 RepID=A0AA39KFL8_9AGAR|nr:hypothetical protein IW261DRAFT_1614826 [Armillaria novae-zelandiae]
MLMFPSMANDTVTETWRQCPRNFCSHTGRAYINYLFVFLNLTLHERHILLSLLLPVIALYLLELSHFDSVHIFFAYFMRYPLVHPLLFCG